MIVDTDIKKLYSVAAAAGNTTAGTAAGSLGDQASTTAITDNTYSNLFPDVTGDESLAGVVKYRCIFVYNSHGTLTYQAARASVSSQIAGGSTIAIAVDGTAASPVGSGSAQAVTIVNENTAPAGAGAFGTGPVTLGDIPPGYVKGLWVRQTTPVGATSPGSDGTDNFVLDITGDSLP